MGLERQLAAELGLVVDHEHLQATQRRRVVVGGGAVGVGRAVGHQGITGPGGLPGLTPGKHTVRRPRRP